MLKKRIGIEAIEVGWGSRITDYFKVPSTLIILPGCEKIEYCTFLSCKNLKKVVIPESVVEIGGRAFRGCIRLKEVVIPKSMERIGDFAFRGCYNATIILKKPKRELKFLGLAAFDGCGYVKEETRS